MRRPLIASCLGLVCFVVFAAAQAPDPGKRTSTETERKTLDATLARMQGLWHIREMRTPRIPSERRLETGYVLVSGLCFSIEIHSGYVAPDGRNIINRDFQSGTHRFELDDAGFMESKSIIGSFLDRLGLLQFEEPSKARRYEVKLGEDEMTWTNAEGTMFVMKKQPAGPLVRRDMFGRPVPEKQPDGKEPK